jgi:SprT protein
MTMTMIEMQEAVKEAVKLYVDIAQNKYSMTLDMPTIQFKVRGKVAGKAWPLAYKLDFNMVLLQENFEHMISQTVPHEVAHLVAQKLYRLDRIKPHGYEWKRVMIAFGKEPDRCHSYDVTRARQATRRPSSKFQYECTGCKRQFVVGATRDRRWHDGTDYKTKCCRKSIRPVENVKSLVAA